LVDDDPTPTSRAPTELELLAEELGLDADTFRDHLRDEVQRRLREKGEACHKLDVALEKRTNGRVAHDGDGPEAPPVHHQQRI
jgi:hypothetical protein